MLSLLTLINGVLKIELLNFFSGGWSDNHEKEIRLTVDNECATEAGPSIILVKYKIRGKSTRFYQLHH